MGSSDSYVAGHCQLGAAAECKAIQCANDWDWKIAYRIECGMTALRHRSGLLRAPNCVEFIQITASSKAAVTGTGYHCAFDGFVPKVFQRRADFVEKGKT